MWLGEEDGKTTEERAQEYLARTSRVNAVMDQELGGQGWLAEDRDNVALGQNMLREEIGYFGPWQGQNYGFEKETQNRLLAHTRQDTASAFAMARSAFREAHMARRVSTRVLWVLAASLAVNILTLFVLVAS